MRLRDKHDDDDDDDSYDDNVDDNDDDGDDDSDDPKAVGDLCDQDLNQTSRQKQACLPPTYNMSTISKQYAIDQRLTWCFQYLK